MPRKRFRETFEVKNEMSDGGKIRPDDHKYRNTGGNSSLEQRRETEREASKVGGFDDLDYENDEFDEILEEDETDFELPRKEDEVDELDDLEMDMKSIKNKVLNFADCSIEEIDEILNFIADRKREELGIDFEFQTVYDDGGRVKPERTQDGLQDVEIGEWPLASIKSDKELGVQTNPIDERKEFIELILQTFHELRHVKQNDTIQDHPIVNKETLNMTRENIVNESFYGFRNRFNYEESMIEVDAMKTSLEETVSFFQEMGIDITPDEVFAVMKEKELSYLDYDMQKFGDTYESAMEYFNKIYGKRTEIKGIPEILQMLPENKRQILDTQCQDLMDNFNKETDIDKKMNLLMQMSLVMSTELREKFPLSDIIVDRQTTTKIDYRDVEEMSEKEINGEADKSTLITNSDVERELQEFYNDEIGNEYLEAYLSEKINQIYGERLGNAGIFNVRKFLDGKLDHFEGVDSYREIIGELEDILEFSEKNGTEIESVDTGVEISNDEPESVEVAEEQIDTEETEAILNPVNEKSLSELMSAYQNMGIKDSDLSESYSIISRTRDERENQNKPKEQGYEIGG